MDIQLSQHNLLKRLGCLPIENCLKKKKKENCLRTLLNFSTINMRIYFLTFNAIPFRYRYLNLDEYTVVADISQLFI